MKILPLFASVVAFGVGMMSVFHIKQTTDFPKPNNIFNQATNGAFRDGLYLGKLAAQGGAEPHVAIGRWTTAEDRASFTAGYQQGYQGYVISRTQPTKRVRQAE
jgi:hypothetical protein